MLVSRGPGFISADLIRLEKDIKRIDPTLSLHVGVVVNSRTGRTVDQRVELWRRVDGRDVYIAAYKRNELPLIIADIHRMRGEPLEAMLDRHEKEYQEKQRDADRIMQDARTAVQDNLRHLREGNRKYTVVPEQKGE